MPKQEIARFSVTYMQILDEHGNLDRELEPAIDEKHLKSYTAIWC